MAAHDNPSPYFSLLFEWKTVLSYQKSTTKFLKILSSTTGTLPVPSRNIFNFNPNTLQAYNFLPQMELFQALSETQARKDQLLVAFISVLRSRNYLFSAPAPT